MSGFGAWLPRARSREAGRTPWGIQPGAMRGATGVGRRMVGSQGGPPGLGAVAGLRTCAGLGPASRWQQYPGGHWGHWGQCHMPLHSCSNEAGGPFGISVRPPPAQHPAPRPPFPCPDRCPRHSPCSGSLLLARGFLVACSWLAVPRCWLSTRGHCGGDSSTPTPGASWTGRRSSLQPHFGVGSQMLLSSAGFWVPHPDWVPRSGMGCPESRREAVGTQAVSRCLQGTPRRGHEHPATAKLEMPITSWPPAAVSPGKTLRPAQKQPQICPITRSPEAPEGARDPRGARLPAVRLRCGALQGSVWEPAAD